MSFYSNFQSDKCPGAVTGNPLNGLTEKVCIQAEKIFDACIKQTQVENYTLELSGFTPENPTYPLTFVSARSLNAEATVTNLNIDRQGDRQCARVQATLTVPVEVLYIVGGRRRKSDGKRQPFAGRFAVCAFSVDYAFQRTRRFKRRCA